MPKSSTRAGSATPVGAWITISQIGDKADGSGLISISFAPLFDFAIEGNAAAGYTTPEVPRISIQSVWEV